MAGHSFLRFRGPSSRGGGADPFALRVTVTGEENHRGEYILYWVQSARRMRSNLALDYAIGQANRTALPVVVYESLRPDYRGASDRIHTFVLEGAAANAREAADRGLRYLFFLPRTTEEARGAVAMLGARARLIVTDEYPAGVVREQTARFAKKAPAALHVIDGNGLLPMRSFEKEQYSARFLRDRAHRLLPDLWVDPPEASPRLARFEGDFDLPLWDGAHPREAAAGCAIDHSIGPVATRGGRDAGLARLDRFVNDGLAGYAQERNRSMRHVSGLSPWLHFGHVGIHEIAGRVLASGAPDEDVDAFLEEAVIRRELSFNFCFFEPRYASLDALPRWARQTLDRHRNDRREPCYAAVELEAAATHDEVWNLAQRQLLVTGTIHGYLRMLWGKKIIEWSETPEEALATMLRLHDVYAVDGRDPNTYAGVLWCFGKHDRPWSPERPIFGSIRWMSSAQTAKKVRLEEIERWMPGNAQPGLF